VTQTHSEAKSQDSAALAAMLASIEELPTIPETLVHILHVIDDPDSGPADLAAAVSCDAPSMAKILTLANSPYYSPRGGIGDIQRCVAVLGYRTVRQVAICVSVATVMVKAMADANGDLDYRELWRHSVVTGAVAKQLAVLSGHPDPEQIFTGGLLHDIGKFILEVQEPTRYAAIIRERAQTKVSLIEAELTAFGYDHAALGAAFARSWRFPAVLVAMFGEHHRPVNEPVVDNSYRVEVRLISLADYISNMIEEPRSDFGFDPYGHSVSQLYRSAGLSEETVDGNMVTIREAIANATSYMSLA